MGLTLSLVHLPDNFEALCHVLLQKMIPTPTARISQFTLIARPVNSDMLALFYRQQFAATYWLPSDGLRSSLRPGTPSSGFQQNSLDPVGPSKRSHIRFHPVHDLFHSYSLGKPPRFLSTVYRRK